jgi:hypothetical protein
MTLKKWAYLAEIGSAIAVVFSLLYVAYELNQNTNAVRGSNWQAVLDYAGTVDLVILQNPDVANIMIKAGSTYDGLTEEEEMRFGMAATNTFQYWEAAYLYHRDGLLDANVWERTDRANSNYLDNPEEGHRGFWKETRQWFDPGFAAHIDGIIEQGGYR